jgi:riboflavin biosynthesis pyrimidine reductase
VSSFSRTRELEKNPAVGHSRHPARVLIAAVRSFQIEVIFLHGPNRTLFAAQPTEPLEVVLPEDLRARYDGDLSFPPAPEERPYCVANFVSTLDGVVSFNIPGQSEGAQISKSNDADRFIMGLLRASVDAVVVGSGTLQAVGPHGSWLPESVYPAAKDLYQKYRTEVLRKLEYPLVVIVAGTGGLDLASAVFHTPRTRVLILTTEQGKRRLSQRGSGALASVEVKALTTAEQGISPSAILTLLRREAGVELLLHEAGPTLFGEFLAGGFMDELFLTVVPQIAGRVAPQTRPCCRRRVLSRDGFLVEASEHKKRSRLPVSALSSGRSQRIEEACSHVGRRTGRQSASRTCMDDQASSHARTAEGRRTPQ